MASIVTLQTGWHEAYKQFGHRYWTETIAACGPNIARVACVSHTCRTDMYKKLQRFEVALPAYHAVVPWKRALTKFGHGYWSELMQTCDANVTRMARLSRTNRTAVYKQLRRFKVAKPANSRTGHRGNWGDLSNEEPQRVSA